MKLKSRQNSEKVRLDVLKAGKTKFNSQQQRCKRSQSYQSAIYEHNQWWLIIYEYDTQTKYTYSVVDATPGIADTDLDLDLVEETEF